MDRLIITAKSSNAGKTTVTLALIAALVKRGLDVRAFKCGPDYIDPLFHRALGVKSYNLDPYFLDKKALRAHFAAHAAKINIIEGVMGYTDGIAGTSEGSTKTVAQWLECPVIFAENLIEYDPKLTIPNRYLGLKTTHAIDAYSFAKAGESLDIEDLLKKAASAPIIKADKTQVNYIGKARIAVSQDEAFCFMYPENIEIMKAIGAEVIPFSPLNDKNLPEGINGLYICGGYPELYTEKILSNASMLTSIRNAVNKGLPTIAECGGFIYLHYAGVFKSKIFKHDKLRRFGYIKLTAKRDNLLCKAGESIHSHEFHYYDSNDPGDCFTAVKPIKGITWEAVHAGESLYAGFPHLYFPANISFAENYIRSAYEYGEYMEGLKTCYR